MPVLPAGRDSLAIMSIPLYHFRFSDHEAIPFEITRIEQMPAVARSAKPARISFYAIFWVTDGAGQRYIDFQAYPVQPNIMYFITPGQAHSWSLQAPLTGFAILFTEDFLLSEKDFLHRFDFFHRIDHAPIIHLTDEQVQDFRHLVEAMMSEYQSNRPGRRQVIQAYLQIFLIQAQRRYDVTALPNLPRADILLIDGFQRLIDRHFLSIRSVQEYASLMAVTPEHLTTTVKQGMGVTAGGLIRARIIIEAKRLLAYTDQTVAEICSQLQFDDPSYFGRFFKRETGQSPLAFRKNILEKYQNV